MNNSNNERLSYCIAGSCCQPVQVPGLAVSPPTVWPDRMLYKSCALRRCPRLAHRGMSPSLCVPLADSRCRSFVDCTVCWAAWMSAPADYCALSPPAQQHKDNQYTTRARASPWSIDINPSATFSSHPVDNYMNKLMMLSATEGNIPTTRRRALTIEHTSINHAIRYTHNVYNSLFQKLFIQIKKNSHKSAHKFFCIILQHRHT